MARPSLLKSQFIALSLVAIATVLFSSQVHAQATTSSLGGALRLSSLRLFES